LNAANRVRFAVILALCVFFSIAWSAEQIPARLTDEAFWQLISTFSEPGGTFVSDNFVSNELAFHDVLTELTDGRKPGGVYLGVGPEQNFTYVAALKPQIAFVLDIRRQNMIEHLTYKALFELSTDRVDFLSRLFSRRLGTDLEKDSSAVVLFNALHEVAPEQELYQANLTSVKERLKTGHGFPLTPEDERPSDTYSGISTWAVLI
jgi:hypothetical protein